MVNKLAVAIVLRSQDPRAVAEDWEPVPPKDVPEFVKDPETMGRLLVHGEIAKEPDGQYWYRAIKRPEVIDEKPAVTH